MPARIPAGPLALWRSQSGRAAASADRCPHRGMSLSHGFVRGETLSCIYHGWSYDRTGHCLRIPAHPGLTPPQAIRAASYRVEEVDGVIWVAEGEPASKPPALTGLVPLRSLTASADLAAIEAAAQAKTTAAGLLQAAGNLTLLLSAGGESETLMHVLVKGAATAAGRIAASRMAENLRRRAEELHHQEAA